MSATELEVRGLTKHFPAGNGLLRNRSQVHAVDDVTFRLEPGTITALVGESGSGKSTGSTLRPQAVSSTTGATSRRSTGGATFCTTARRCR